MMVSTLDQLPTVFGCDNNNQTSKSKTVLLTSPSDERGPSTIIKKLLILIPTSLHFKRCPIFLWKKF